MSRPGVEAGHAAPEEFIRAQAFGLGFDLVGIAAAGPAESVSHFDTWLAAGYGGEMEYLARGAERRRDTRLPVRGVRSAVVVALDYGGREKAGPVARYARGDDYHDVMLERLRVLHDAVNRHVGRTVPGKAYVDTGPILERDLARRAGLGWFGKNTNLLHPQRGSFFFLGSLLLDLELQPDEPFEGDHCGTCTRCLEACPTGALREERVLDATRCISYLTIELRGAIPEELRAPIGELIYGCDICQDVCPWNVRFAATLPPGSPLAPRELLTEPDPRGLARRILGMTPEDFSRAFRGSPVKRAKHRGLQRNAAVVLGNVGDADDLLVLDAAAAGAEPMVRDHIVWARERIRARLAGEPA